jgi:hypothetical protein
MELVVGISSFMDTPCNRNLLCLNPMIVELDKEDLLSLVKGDSPHYDLFTEFEKEEHGRYVGGFTDDWRWNISALMRLDEEKLWEIYTRCKLSWK